MSIDSPSRRSAPGATAVVIGVSISGLAMAMALARSGAHVEIVERDLTPDPDLDEINMEQWWRRGISQARQSHTCLALGRQLLKTWAPEIFAALLAAGAQVIPSGARLSPDGRWRGLR
jgi:2-polyprenyl-6-methoxyphenol hydroxylase-like FAD-dependent oxidoreductase